MQVLGPPPPTNGGGLWIPPPDHKDKKPPAPPQVTSDNLQMRNEKRKVCWVSEGVALHIARTGGAPGANRAIVGHFCELYLIFNNCPQGTHLRFERSRRRIHRSDGAGIVTAIVADLFLFDSWALTVRRNKGISSTLLP